MNEILDINKYSKEELSEMLKLLNFYKGLRKSVGERAKSIYDRVVSGKETIRVEYFPSMKKEDVESIIKDLYGELISNGNIEWKANERLKGGIRIFFGDDLTEISFARFEETFKNNQ